MKEIRQCIAFYERRRWNWVGAVGFLCHLALVESAQRKADAMAEAMKGVKYRAKPNPRTPG
jgi:hypothetical protein